MTVMEYELDRLKRRGYVEINGSPDYYVDMHGSIVDMVCDSPRELRRYVDRDGNNIVTIIDETGTPHHVEVGKIVALHFVANDYGYDEILHLDGNKGNNYYGNLVWDEIGDFNVNYIPKKEKTKKIVVDGWAKRRDIRCRETDKVYKSMAEAALDLGVSTQYISKKLKTDGKVKGYHLQFVGEEAPITEGLLVCENLDTGFTSSFNSIKEASDELGLDKHKIVSAIKTGNAVDGNIFRIEEFTEFG